MGTDIQRGGRTRKHFRRNVQSENIYLRLLVRLYKFLARRTGSAFNTVVFRRLITPRVHRPVLSLNRLVRFTKKHVSADKEKIVVIVGTVTDDKRSDVPEGLQLCALRVTDTLRARIEAAGGKVLTFDQLALLRPRGSNCILIRGRKSTRTATKYFGTPGTPGSKTRPRVISKGRKFERARGRRPGCGYKK